MRRPSAPPSPAAPDYRYYTAARDHRSGGRATLSVARKLARRCYHTLRELGEEALAPSRVTRSPPLTARP